MENPELKNEISQNLFGILSKKGNPRMSKNNGRYYSNDRLHIEIDYLKDRSSRVEEAVTKLADVNNNVSRLLAVHDQRIDQTDRTIEKIENKLDIVSKDMKDRDAEIIKQIHEKIDSHTNESNKRIDEIKGSQKETHEAISSVKKTIDRFILYGWFIAGGFFTLTILFPNLEVVKKILALVLKL